MKWLSLGSFAVAMGALFACSSSSGPPYPDVTSFCTALAKAECQVSTSCGATTPTACEAATAQSCQAGAASYSIGRRTFTASKAQACIEKATEVYAATAGTPPNPLVSAASLTALNTICQDVFSGSVADNGQCLSDYDCANSKSVCTRGFCGPATSVAEGSDCNNPGDQCTNSYCAQATSNSPFVCIPLLVDGQACTTNAQCVDRCDPSTHVCAPLAGAGVSCTGDTDCLPSVGFCSPYSGNKCESGENFDPTETALCTTFQFGFGATYNGTPVVASDDAGGGSPGTLSDAGTD